MSDDTSYTPAPPNPKTTLKNPWVLIPLLLFVGGAVAVRLSFSRDTVGILYRPLGAVVFHGITLPPVPESGVWYETRPWLGKGPDDRKTVWPKGLHYSVFFSLTEDSPDIWLARVAAERDLFRTGEPYLLIYDNPCIIEADAAPARPRPKVEGVMAHFLLKGGVQVQVSGKTDRAGLERLIGQISCG